MKTFELYLKDGRAAGVFACGECRSVHSSEYLATQCCDRKCSACGGDVEKYWTMCQKCRDEKHEQAERERFEKAEKVTEWDGFVYDGDKYYQSAEELLDWVGDGELDLPEYVWTCTPNQFVAADLSDITERVCDDAYEDFDPDDLNGLEELKAAIDKFNEANAGILSYEPNYKKALLLSNLATEKQP